jgi:hypothetical protein
MTLFDIHEVETEVDATSVANTLMKDAIVASSAQRGRQKKMRATASKIDMLTKLCVLNKWADPLKVLEKAFSMLEQARNEMDSAISQMFQI